VCSALENTFPPATGPLTYLPPYPRHGDKTHVKMGAIIWSMILFHFVTITTIILTQEHKIVLSLGKA
jgi:hypothetical protein